MSGRPGKNHPGAPTSASAARRINERWIVHGDLRDNARDYLRHLERTDPARLERSCAIALRLVHGRRRQEDPKPLFYAGMFGLATAEEAAEYLAGHQLTLAVWRAVRGEPVEQPPRFSAALVRSISDQVAEAMLAVPR
jgi:hypothetical protein